MKKLMFTLVGLAVCLIPLNSDAARNRPKLGRVVAETQNVTAGVVFTEYISYSEDAGFAFNDRVCSLAFTVGPFPVGLAALSVGPSNIGSCVGQAVNNPDTSVTFEISCNIVAGSTIPEVTQLVSLNMRVAGGTPANTTFQFPLTIDSAVARSAVGAADCDPVTGSITNVLGQGASIIVQ